MRLVNLLWTFSSALTYLSKYGDQTLLAYSRMGLTYVIKALPKKVGKRLLKPLNKAPTLQ
jgi:hypothetical protein